VLGTRPKTERVVIAEDEGRFNKIVEKLKIRVADKTKEKDSK
jgi:hypothetical protein